MHLISDFVLFPGIYAAGSPERSSYAAKSTRKRQNKFTNSFYRFKFNLFFLGAARQFTLKPAAHGEEKAEQTTSRGGLLSRFLTVCGELLVRNWPREAVRKKSNMFDIFRLARQIPHCVRPS